MHHSKVLLTDCLVHERNSANCEGALWYGELSGCSYSAFFREGYDDVFAGDKSFMYGRSVANQRIEAWWSILRKMNTDLWINYFKDLRETGLYDDDIVHVHCLKFCFMPLIREELHHVTDLWNLHKIRPQPSNRDSPSGRPDIL